MRQRDLKPGFFDNPELAALGAEAMLLFAGLWCYADREGRLKENALRIRAAVFPYNPERDIIALLDALCEAGFILRYEADDECLIWIPTFKEHQHVHPREAQSKLAPHPSEGMSKDMPRADQGHAITGGTSSLSSPRHVKPSASKDKTLSFSDDEERVISYFCEKQGCPQPTPLQAISIARLCRKYTCGAVSEAIGQVAMQGTAKNFIALVTVVLKEGSS